MADVAAMEENVQNVEVQISKLFHNMISIMVFLMSRIRYVLIVDLIVRINGLTNSRIDIRRDFYEKGII